MKKMKMIVLIVILMVLVAFTVGIAAEATFMNEANVNTQNHIKNDPQPMFFDVDITFYVQTGEGCGCTPIVGASVQAFGGEGSDSGVTNEDGMCVLTLVVSGEYEVIIEADKYQEINFEFNVIDEQTFIFHMFEKQESSAHEVSLFHSIMRNIFER